MKSQTPSFSFLLSLGLQFIGFSNKKNRIVFITLFLGIAGGLAVLLLVIGIMNGFQNNYITRRLEVGSYHIEITKKNGITKHNELIEKLYEQFPSAEAVIPYIDREIILLFKNKANSDRQPVKLRAIDIRQLQKDKNFLKYCTLVRGSFDIPLDGLLLGEELGWREVVYAKIGHTIYATPEITLQSLKQEGQPYKLHGYFNTGSYDYDRYWVFANLEGYMNSNNINAVDAIGMKFSTYEEAKKWKENINNFLGNEYEVRGAEEINRGYFAALKLEKAMISFLFFIIFALVCVTIYGALKLMILEKKEQILILKALGLSPHHIILVFMCEPLILALGGTIVGLLLGVLISYNLLSIFTIIENILNWLLAKAIPIELFTPIKLYDTSIYYQTNLPVQFYLNEIILSSCLLVSMVLLSAGLPVFKAAKMRPSEINRESL